MLDFLRPSKRYPKAGLCEVYPDFLVQKCSDLMVRGGDFYAVWNENTGLWSTDEFEALALMDKELDIYGEQVKEEERDRAVKILHIRDYSTKMIKQWHDYVKQGLPDNYHALDETLIFSNTVTTKKDYASKKLNYPLLPGDISAYEELVSTLYSPTERQKIEWAIGAIVSGDSKEIQKFVVMYGSAGTGKSTVLNIIQQLFDGYYSVFDAKALGTLSNSFALEAFKSNPLVAIQHDGDLSRIEDNTRLNSVVSHELMTVNEKFKSTYANRFNSFLFMGTNRPVRITDAKSGIIRRLIDISPTGDKVSQKRYKELVSQIKFELGAIADHCLNVYLENKNLYDDYVPIQMLGASNDFYNFVMENFDLFKTNDGTSLKASYALYDEYCKEAKITYPYTKRIFKEELKNYFRDFKERFRTEDGTEVWNYYSGFLTDKFEYTEKPKATHKRTGLIFEETESLLDKELADCPAQYANDQEVPSFKWEKIITKLSELDTTKLHYVKVPENHIVIDFDIRDKEGNKSYKKNLEAASKLPPTYGELSKSGSGIHLHYIYDGDISKLSRVYDDEIEVKIFTGNSSLRRKLVKCNNKPIAHINSGLPLKGEVKMINEKVIKSEKGLRTQIKRNLNKEIWPNTAPSISLIAKILEDAYNNGLHYDVTDMRPSILAFAAKSSHQSSNCIKMVNEMKFKSDDISDMTEKKEAVSDEIVFFDVEVFPNLFVIVWKFADKQPVTMINPTPEEVEDLMKYRLVGFNCRRYDNHILYARMMGYTNLQLYNLSQRIINGSKNAFFGEAYNISYADIYDFSSKKQSLKKFEIELGIHHQELGLRWDEPVEESLWTTVADYCINDVVATEAVFNARQQDFVARKVLAELSGLSINDTTRMHSTKIIFGSEKNPELEYTDLSTLFPGYTFENGKSSYMGEDPGEGGYVYAEPGMYVNVALLDIASMHPSSIRQLNLFGQYTKNFTDILDARLCIKHHDFEKAGSYLNGAFLPYLKDNEQADMLAQALKIVINSVYGYTTATFDNPFKDSRNVDNIVAKRGSLFMINLKHEVQKKGFTVAHIKTDSIKIPNATPEIIQFVMDYGKQYGYNFEHEATYDRMCLVNDAVYIAKYKDGKHAGEWTATGAQFQHPYVFKTLFSREQLEFNDYCETKTVSTALYLDLNESKITDLYAYPEFTEAIGKLNLNYHDISTDPKVFEKVFTWCRNKHPELSRYSEEEFNKIHDYHFVGKAGQFCPIKAGMGGGILLREKDGKYYAATGSKGYRWLESEVVRNLSKEKDIDKNYFAELADDAIATITEYGNFDWFVSKEPNDGDNTPYTGYDPLEVETLTNMQIDI